MSMVSIGPIIFGTTDNLITYLTGKGLLASSKTCTRCPGVAMVKRPRRDVTDGVCWWCPSCKTRKSIRDGSFFSKSRLPLMKWVLLMHWWAWEYPVTKACREAEVDEGTAIDVYRWLREVCSTRLLQTQIVLGGPGNVVHIDESLFRHKPKNHRGRPTQQEIWVFGLVDVSHNPAMGVMEIVPDRSAATLLPIIQRHVAPGTVIHSDEWSAYRRVSTLPNVAGHHTVNHSLNFVSPTGIHTQNIESYWARCKAKIKSMKGCHAAQLPSYLDEFMWREHYGSDGDNAFNGIINDISAFHTYYATVHFTSKFH